MAIETVFSKNSTLETVNDYINDARVLLQDLVSPYRYDDASLLEALSLMMQQGRLLRADLFVFNDKGGDNPPSFSVNDSTLVPIEPQFRLAFLYGMVGHAISRDQDDVQDERAIWYLNTMSNVLTGRNMVQAQSPAGG